MTLRICQILTLLLSGAAIFRNKHILFPLTITDMYVYIYVAHVFQCDMYACVGVEVVAMMAGKISSSISYTGSHKGMNFMNKRLDILSDFVNFSRGKCVRSITCMYYIHILFMF